MQDSQGPHPSDSEGSILGPSESLVGKLLVASTFVDDPVLRRSVCLVVHQDLDNVFGVLLNRPMAPSPQLSQMLGASHGQATNIAGPNASGEHVLDATSARPIRRTPRPHSKPIQGITPTFPSSFADAPEDTDHPEQNRGPEPMSGQHLAAQQAAAEASKALGTIHFGGPLSGPVVAVHDSREHAEASAGRGVYVAAKRELLERLVENRPGSMRLIVGHLGWSLEQLIAEKEAGFWHVIDATDEDVFASDQELWPNVIRRATTHSLADWLELPGVPAAAEVN